MKKFVVLLVVVAMTCFSAMAFAADVTVGGSLEIRSRNFSNINTEPDGTLNEFSGVQRDTQQRIRLDVNAKAGDVKGKIQLESDFQDGTDWGTANDTTKVLGATASGYVTNPGLGFREAWLSFNLPGIPVNVTAGRQLLTLGNGWFYRSMHYGSDAWVIANQTGPNTAAFVNVKVAENDLFSADDVDAYVLLDVFKLNDNMTIGVDFTNINDRRNATGLGDGDAEVVLQNLGANFNGKIGPVALKAQVDLQMGKAKDNDPLDGTVERKFKGNQVVLQAGLNFDPVGVNVTLARGSGNKAGSNDYKGFQSFLDVDPHYTFLYEYKVNAASGAKNSGFENTTAMGAGVTFAATKSLTVGADAWLLAATEDTNLEGGLLKDDLGLEVDLKVNWKMYDNLAWNWTAGIFKPGDAYKDAAGQESDDVMGVQGVLAFKF